MPRTANTEHERRKTEKLVSLLLSWFAKNARDLPWRRTRDPYGIWVSEIMLQQTQVKTVMPYWERWMRELPTISSLAKSSPEKIHKLWEGLGYYTRVRNMQKAAQSIENSHAGKFPDKFDDVLALPASVATPLARFAASPSINPPRFSMAMSFASSRASSASQKTREKKAPTHACGPWRRNW